MNLPWNFPVVQSVVDSGKPYALYQQYPQPLIGYESYFNGFPWVLPSYYTSTSINQYGMIVPYMAGWYQPHVTHPGEVGSPPAKRMSPMSPGDDLLLPHPDQVDFFF